MKKLKIVSVSANSGLGSMAGDRVADVTLRSEGFTAQMPSGSPSIGAIPASGKSFVVYYEAPPTDSEKFAGRFRLVETTNGTEREIDHGSACDSHVHGGTGTMTFYGRGDVLESWSFHCQPQA
jgi:hypothetical protein